MKIIVMENGRLGMVREVQDRLYEGRHMATILDGDPDFVALAKARSLRYDNIRSARAESNAEARRLAAEMLECQEPYILVCRVDPETPTI